MHDDATARSARQSRRSIAAAARCHIHDAAGGGVPGATAVYSLADPRDVRGARYVGQTRDPQRRFAQHVRTARLWLPDDVPWWVRSPRYRPLYVWIRELHREGGRLPFMWIEQWVPPEADALAMERATMMRLLSQGAALLNVEASRVGAQLPLL